jgi:hypothetical protein
VFADRATGCSPSDALGQATPPRWFGTLRHICGQHFSGNFGVQRRRRLVRDLQLSRTLTHAIRALLVLVLLLSACAEQPGGAAGSDAGTGSDAAMDASGSAASDAGPKLRQFPVLGSYWNPLSECVDGACPPGQTCFSITKELQVCDAAQPTEVTECNPTCSAVGSYCFSGPTECACDAGPCAPEKVCTKLEHTCSCAPQYYTKCVERSCATPSDCPVGTVCVPSSLNVGARCITPKCTTDADCVAAPGGLCALFVHVPQQGGEYFVDSVECFYP